MLLDRELLKKAGVFAFASAELIVTIGGGFFLGDWLDRRLGLPLVFTMLFTIAGLGYSVWRFEKLFKSGSR